MLFDLLRPEPRVLEVWRGALAARLRDHHRVVAVVTASAPAVARAVNGQRDAAVRTLERVTALTADDRRRIPATVEQDDDLLAAHEARLDRGGQIAADDDVRTLYRLSLIHISEPTRLLSISY